MKLKYYLRGIGIGVFITTIIFMISISIHKEELESQAVQQEKTNSQTVVEYEKSTLEVNTEQEEKAVETEKPVETEKVMETEKPVETEKVMETEKPVETEKVIETEKSAETKKQQEVSKNKKEKKKKNKAKKVRFEVGGGEYSDVICRNLQKLGLVDDAEAFNKYLIENNYDNSIQPGVYDIPKDSTYDEIAKLLITRISKEKSE